jgi:hypothetical protein
MVSQAWRADQREREISLAERHPVRAIANSVTMLSWRNGPIENVHAGSFVGHALNERRILPRDESAVVRHAQEGLLGALKAVDLLRRDRAWPPPAVRVLPFMRPFAYSIGWSCTEQSRVVILPMHCNLPRS